MARFHHLIFVCTNERDPSDPRGSCKARGSQQLLERLKALVAEHGLKGKVRVTASGCLDYCAKGCVAVAFSSEQPGPETWYTRLQPEDAEALFIKHVVQGEPFAERVEAKAHRGK